MIEETLPKNQIENILTLCCFDTNNKANIIFNLIDPAIIGNQFYQNIYIKIKDYYSIYKTSPKEHISDLLTNDLSGKSNEIYKRLLLNLYKSKDNLNVEFVLSSLSKFIESQNLKQTIIEAGELTQNGQIEQAKLILKQFDKNTIQTQIFNPGIRLNEHQKAFELLSQQTNIQTGIKVLDDLGICPAPKELYILLALPHKGKTWFLIHLGKMGLLQGKKILHITLEMSEIKILKRYYQSLFALTTKHSEKAYDISLLNRDNEILKSIEPGVIEYPPNKPILDFSQLHENILIKDSYNIETWLTKRLNHPMFENLLIKEFPSGLLTINMLEAYLDSLASIHNFIPDMILLDYLDIMTTSSDNRRIDIGNLFTNFRGLAQHRNFAGVSATQGNRLGEDARILTRKHLSEDYSKCMIVDNLITYNQTESEFKIRCARMWIDKARDADKQNQLFLMTQNYNLGQFYIDSIVLNKQNSNVLKERNVQNGD